MGIHQEMQHFRPSRRTGPIALVGEAARVRQSTRFRPRLGDTTFVTKHRRRRQPYGTPSGGRLVLHLRATPGPSLVLCGQSSAVCDRSIASLPVRSSKGGTSVSRCLQCDV